MFRIANKSSVTSSFAKINFYVLNFIKFEPDCVVCTTNVDANGVVGKVKGSVLNASESFSNEVERSLMIEFIKFFNEILVGDVVEGIANSVVICSLDSPNVDRWTGDDVLLLPFMLPARL